MACCGVLSLALWCCLMGSSLAARQVTVQRVPVGYQRVAQAHLVPPESLYALALAESSVSLWRGKRPWPWTINVAGRGYRYATRLAAWRALQIFMLHTSLKKIDVGIAQVNLGWHGHRFYSSWQAFDPYTNLSAAADILRRCWERHPGSWLEAAGCYHHPAGGQAATVYRRRMAQQLAMLLPGSAPAFTQVFGAGQDVAGIWYEPRGAHDEAKRWIQSLCADGGAGPGGFSLPEQGHIACDCRCGWGRRSPLL